MKKILCGLFAATLSLTAMAEGYQVNTLSARQNGMGHTGTALHLGAESMFFNPAGMASMKETIDFSGSMTAIFADATATVDSHKWETANDPSTPLNFSLAWKAFDMLKFGVSLYTPYGSSINWTDNWPGAVLSQSVNLRTFTLQPTVAWEIVPGLSVGAGAMITWGNVDLSKGLVRASSLDALLAMTGSEFRFGHTSPASIGLKGNARVAVGVNVGAMWDITRQWTVGSSFRSKMMMRVRSGQAELRYANALAEKVLSDRLNILDRAEFAAEMPCPAVWTIGAAYRPIPQVTVAFDAQLNFWSAYKTLDIEFLSEQLTPYNQHIEKNYRNAWTFHAGVEWGVTHRFDLRAGMVVDTTPVNSAHYNPETPGMTKVEPSVGLSFKPLKWLSIDASVMYVAGLGADNRSCTYPDLLTGKEAVFTADYDVHAWCPSIGLNLKF